MNFLSFKLDSANKQIKFEQNFKLIKIIKQVKHLNHVFECLNEFEICWNLICLFAKQSLKYTPT